MSFHKTKINASAVCNASSSLYASQSEGQYEINHTQGFRLAIFLLGLMSCVDGS